MLYYLSLCRRISDPIKAPTVTPIAGPFDTLWGNKFIQFIKFVMITPVKAAITDIAMAY